MENMESKKLPIFDMYLSIWVILCIIAGVIIGKIFPAGVNALSKIEVAQVNIPVAILIWLMIYPMMLQIDFSSIIKVGKEPKGLIVTLVVNWIIKPFSMALFAFIFMNFVFKAWINPSLAKEYIAGAILLGAAPCTAIVFVWSNLTPVELVALIKPGLVLLGFLLVINLIFHISDPFYGLLSRSIFEFVPYLGAGILGAVIVPVLLPYIPGRAFSWKGWLLGLLRAILYLWFILPVTNLVTAAAHLFLLPPIVSYLAMNFTGATVYTSLSGVVAEMKIAVPAQIISAGCGILFMIGRLFV